MSELLGIPIGVAIPLQRHHPALDLGASLGELLALAALILTGRLPAFVTLVGFAASLVALGATNAHRILAIGATGTVVLLASRRGRPLAALGPACQDLGFGTAAGLGVAVRMNGSTWWAGRSAFARVRLARELLQPERCPDETATEGEWRG